MLIIRYEEKGTAKLAAVTNDEIIYPLPYQDFLGFVQAARDRQVNLLNFVLQELDGRQPLEVSFEQLKLLAPIEASEIWAAGVTYARSREARNHETSHESQTEKSIYDKVYDAVRPEIFLKSSPLRSVGPNEELCLRSDSQWQVPEPELGLVLDQQGGVVGYTIGNDLSCRDIEGENPLYLPQAKIWRRSCSIGPAIKLAEAVQDPYDLQINCRIYRNDQIVFEDSVNTCQLKRKFEELVSFLVRDNDIYDGTILLTGTGIVPPHDFALAAGDKIDISISEIGMLSNRIR